MSVWRSRSCALLAAGAVACASPEPTQPGTASLPPGCFRLTLGAWSGPHEAVDPPLTLSLMDSIGSSGMENGQRIVRPVPVAMQTPYPWMWWKAVPADSLHLVFTGGFVGVYVDLARRDSAWEGVATAFTDVAPSMQATAAAALTSMFCPPS